MSNKILLIVFDVDGTLVSPKSGKAFRENADDWAWMPNRLAKYRQLQQTGVQLAVATNQAGPLWRLATGQQKYPSAQDHISQSLRDMILQLSWRPTQCDPWFISIYDARALDMVTEQGVQRLKDEMFHVLEGMNCYIGSDPEWRKPRPGMLQAIMRHYEVDAEQTLFVGDRPEDEQAALAAGVSFQMADAFFSDNADRD